MFAKKLCLGSRAGVMFLNHFEMHKPVDVVKMLPESNEAHVEELLKVLVIGGSATMDPPCHTCP